MTGKNRILLLQQGDTLRRNGFWTLLARVAAAAVLQCSLTAIALAEPLPYTTGFESPDFNAGSINSQASWTVFSSTGEVTSAAAHSGSQSLLVNPQAGDDNTVKTSTPIFPASGETPSIFVPTPDSSYMATDFWFRTVSTSPDGAGYVSISLGNPASVRNTWLGVTEGSVFDATPGSLHVAAIDYDAGGAERDFLSPELIWGQWYHATISEQYVNGHNNDLVTYSLADAANHPVWSTTIGSWENFYAANPGTEQGPGPVVSNRASFGGRAGGQGIYVDDFSVSNLAVVPEPSSIALAAMGLLGLAGFAAAHRRQRSGMNSQTAL